MHNEGGANNWIGFRLLDKSGRDAYGAIVTVKAGGLTQTKICQSAGSYMSASDPRTLFGLGTATKIESATVRWPGGGTSVISTPLLGCYMTIKR